MRRGPRPSALVAAALLALTAACGAQEAGAAAVVGDRRISESELQQATADIQRIAPPDSALSPQQVLTWLITEPYMTRAATQNGVGVSLDQARQFFSQAQFTADDGSGTPSDPALRAVQSVLSLNNVIGRGPRPLQQDKAVAAMDQVSEELQQAGVRVNPRYGSFADTWREGRQQPFFAVGQGEQPNWLVPSPTPTASGSPQPGTEPNPTP
jgi:hypothetical protein